jgi:Ca-activated chloride channel homolog
MHFAHPHLLWLLLVIPPAMVIFFWWAWRKRQRLLTQFIQARLLPNLTVGISTARQKVRIVSLVIAACCLILALARPQWGFDWEEVRQRGLDIVVAIDTSRSMLAEDIAPNRLTRAKLAALDLMQLARSDRLGLVAFAGTAFLQCPLTIDDSAFRQSVEALDVNIIPQGGSALAEAIDEALTAFKEGDNFKVLVLFSDGEDHESGAVEAARKAAANGLRIFTIGIGSAEGELLRIKDAKGRTDYIRDEQGNVIKSRLNEELLREIAEAGSGFYLPLRGAGVIDTLYENGLAPLPKSESGERLVRRYHERYHWPLGLAIALLLFESLFPERKRAAPRKRAGARATSAALPIAAALVLLTPNLLPGSPSRALREYEAGNYELALKEFQELLQKRSGDARLHFNAGTAAYRSGQWDEAERHFSDALISPDLKMQEGAYYNRGNARFRLGESALDPAQQSDAWEKSLKDFESALTLNPDDADAQFNYRFVKQKLEELKQQQQEQPGQDKSDQQQQDQQDQQSQQQQKQDGDEQQQQPSEQAESEKDESQEQQAKDSPQQQEHGGKDQEQADSPRPQPDKPEPGEEQEAPPDVAPGQMTQREAEQLLDAQKGDEKLLPVRPTEKKPQSERPIRDW